MSNLISTLLLLTSAAIFFGYINPTYRGVTGKTDYKERSVFELKEEWKKYDAAITKTREIETKRTGLLERYNAIALEDRERLEKLLPDHIDSVRLIIDINNIASQYGMTLKNITLSESGNNGGSAGENSIGPSENQSEGVGLKFGILGSYENFRTFLADLEQSLRLVDVKTITFTASESANYDYTVTIQTYKLTKKSDATL